MSEATAPYRKTRKRYEVPKHLRFLTFSCYQRLPLFSNDKIKNAFVDQLEQTRERTHFRLIAWVIMPEHVHLLIVPRLPEYPVSTILSDLKGNYSNRILRRWRKIDAPILNRVRDKNDKSHFWQVGGGYDRNIFSFREYGEKLHYIHCNPVKRGLVCAATDWLWSSALWYAGKTTKSLIRIDHDVNQG